MKREIELPTRESVARKINLGIGLSAIDLLSIGKEDVDVQLAALQEAYDQGYGDAKPKWRPIEEAPMDGDARIMATDGNSVATCYWSGVCWIDEKSYSNNPYRATHWQPLPEPPTR